MQQSTPFDTFDVTGLLAEAGETLVLGLQGYNPNRTVAKFLLEMHVIHENGTEAVYGTNAHSWTAFDCSRTFGLGLDFGDTTGGAYIQPQERIDSRLYPAGWTAPSFGGQWQPALEQSSFRRRLEPKSTQALVLVEQAPITLEQTAPGRFFFDVGQETQATLVLSASVPPELAGQTISVELGESLRAPREVRYPGFTGNHFAATFVLGAGEIELETHECKWPSSRLSHPRCLFAWLSIVVRYRHGVSFRLSDLRRLNRGQPTQRLSAARQDRSVPVGRHRQCLHKLITGSKCCLRPVPLHDEGNQPGHIHR